MAQAAGSPLTKPEVVGMIRRAIALGDGDRARKLTIVLVRRVREERDRRAAAQRRRYRRRGGITGRHHGSRAR